MGVFSDMAVDLFADANMAQDALYKSGSSPAVQIRLIRRELVDGPGPLGGIGTSIQGIEIEVLAIEVPNPQEGDQISLGLPPAGISFDSAAIWAAPATAKVRRVKREPQRATFILTLNRDIV